MSYHSVGVRNRVQYATQRIEQLESIDKRHWRLEENAVDNNHSACVVMLSSYIETSLRQAKYHHGFHKAVLCVEIFKHMLFNLDREALSPLFVYCEAMEHFVASIHKTKALDGANNAGVSPLSPSPTTTARDTLSPRFKRSGVAPMPLTIPLTPGRPKRFIELPKQERHVLQVAFYLKDVLTKLAGSIGSKPAGKFKSHRMPVVATSMTTTTVDILPLDVVRALRAIKTKLRKNEFFADLPNLVADAGKTSKGGDSRQANTHQAFSSFFLCLHEVVRSTSYHSIELADGAFDLLGEVLRAIQNYIVEVVGQRKEHRSRIRGLRALRQQLRAQFAAMEAETHDIAQEAIKLSTVLSAIEFELDVLHDECEWHAQSKRLFLDTIGALRDASDQPPLVFVNADGSSKVLQPGTAILRAENVPHIRYLVQLLALSRSFVHVRLNDPRVMDANPSRKLTLNKMNHQGRAETLKMHLMNQRPRDAAAVVVDPTPPPNGNEGAAGGASPGDKSAAAAANALHKVTDAELTALSSIHECLRAVEGFMGDEARRDHSSTVSTGCQIDASVHLLEDVNNPADSISSGGVSSGPDNSTGAVVLARELAKLPMPWRTAFSLLHDDETATLLSKDEMLHDVSAIYAAYDDMLVRPSHHDEVILNTTTLPFTAFVMSYFMVFPRKVPSTSHESSADSCIEPDAEIRQGPAWASWECARLVVSVQVHVQGAVGVDWLGYFAVFLGLSRTLTLPLPRALDAFLLARRMLYATTVMRQRHADPSSMDVIWVMAKDAMLPSAAYSLHTTAVKILGTFTRTPDVYLNVLADKSTSVDLFTEDDVGNRGVSAALVLHVDTALLVLMQAWVREHHHTLQVLQRIFGAALTHDDGSISYGEFVTMWGFIDSTIPLDRLCTIYMHAAQHDSASACGDAATTHLIQSLYTSECFAELKKPWLGVSAMHVACPHQRVWDEGVDGLVAMWRATRDRVLDRLGELKATTQVNLAMVHTCEERQVKLERLLAAATAVDCDDVPTAVEMAWFACHFLQQDIHATTHAIMRQQKPNKKPHHWAPPTTSSVVSSSSKKAGVVAEVLVDRRSSVPHMQHSE
ncbi:hypothetical protein, variant 1 [Aphanomyces astaci]|uniref:Uncharacterized protein n=1 Tax=Aphanomyces astaci TaxID=112090 RepID=W4FW48_APHAT|nr:hypothetical protein, variant 1 [Aphanomyces astaci]ETV70883.1 hypothetical protein, variant 1 [Aphanomyces astaci]|eukprot:XP_009839547.1 hypothetical protein, variant 1 [Aphanomyces astaci]